MICKIYVCDRLYGCVPTEDVAKSIIEKLNKLAVDCGSPNRARYEAK